MEGTIILTPGQPNIPASRVAITPMPSVNFLKRSLTTPLLTTQERAKPIVLCPLDLSKLLCALEPPFFKETPERGGYFQRRRLRRDHPSAPNIPSNIIGIAAPERSLEAT